MTIDGISALFTPVSAAEFSQEAIDGRAGDLEWLGAAGFRHQSVVAEAMKQSAIVPLRAFTLFSSEEALRSWLRENREMLSRTLERLAGRQEWTLKIEIEPVRWSAALTGRVPELAAMSAEIDSAAPGKAFLLRKKLEEGKKSASQSAERELVEEVERAVVERLQCETFAESREARDGAFPQINLLIPRDEEASLQAFHLEMTEKYEPEGVALALTGPWPPYTFAR